MNRTFVLQCIEKHLTELDTDSTRLRPLGEIIPIIAKELRSHRNGSVPQTRVLPVAVVAAFIEGNATEEEERNVCEAILIDNSVLAEITATVRAQRQFGPQMDSKLSTEPLSDSLTDRLLQLVPSENDLCDRVLDNSAINNSATEQEIQVNEKDARLAAHLPRVPQWMLWSSLVAVAAAIALAVWLGLPLSNDPVQRNLATDEPSNAPNPSNVVENAPVENAPDTEHFDVVAPSNPPSDAVVESGIDKGIESVTPLDTNTVMKEPDSSNPPKNKVDDAIPQASPKLELQPRNYASDTAKSPELRMGLKWSKIQGLLARQHAGESSGASRSAKWSGTVEGSTIQLPAETTQALRLKTFPGSHAQASLTSGGRMVLNGDSSIEIKSSDGAAPDYLLIDQGAVALIDFPQGTQMEIGFGGNRLATLRWESKASVVLGGSASGLQSQIASGTISVNDKTYRNATLSIDQTHTQELKSVARGLPNWVNRPTESPVLPKAILGQLSQADDIAEAINELMRASNNGRSLDELTRSQLVGWRSAFEEDDLFHALGNRGPVLRVLAFKRALQQPAWSAKWQEFWPRLEQSVGDAEKVVTLKTAVAFAQSNKRITLDQAIQVVTAMDTRDRVSRVLTDLLLRQLVGNGPAYNADGNDAENTRSIGLWRRYINATLKRQ